MTRLSNWIPVFTGMTWKVDSGPDSNAGQAFRRSDDRGCGLKSNRGRLLAATNDESRLLHSLSGGFLVHEVDFHVPELENVAVLQIDPAKRRASA